MSIFDNLPDDIIKFVHPEPNTGCWLWGGNVDVGGYGRCYAGMKIEEKAHRVLYAFQYGSVPNGLLLDHKCRVRSCCNPDHLEPVTCQENLRRGVGVQRCKEYFEARTHCRNGHEFAVYGFNLSVKRGVLTKYCKECRRIFDAKRWSSKVEKLKLTST